MTQKNQTEPKSNPPPKKGTINDLSKEIDKLKKELEELERNLEKLQRGKGKSR